MSELTPIADFPAGVAKVQTMADGSPRFILDAEESANKYLSVLGECQAQKRYLHVVIYDEDQFQALLDQKRT
jgi:hypothetical protein